MDDCVCEGHGTLMGHWVFGREHVCTCGALPESSTEVEVELTVHSGDCDTVSCPFCQLRKVM